MLANHDFVMLASLRDNTARARQARLTFLLLTLTSGAVPVLGLLAQSRGDWGLVNQEDGASALTLAVYFGFCLLVLGHIVLVVVGYVVLIRWLRRAYYNLWQLPDAPRPSFSEGWAAGAWFVPFLNLARPYTIVREVWEGTERVALGGYTATAPSLLGWWWAAHLISLFVGRITSRITSNGQGITQRDVMLLTVEAAFALVAAWLTWRVIGQVAGFEEMLAARQQVNDLGKPAPPAPSAEGQSDYALEGGY